MAVTLSAADLEKLQHTDPRTRALVLQLAKTSTIPFIVTETTRTEEQQRENIAKGVSWTMNSKHLADAAGESRAVDIVPLGADGKPSWDWALYRQLAPQVWQAAADVGLTDDDLEWGGNWKKTPDGPHWQLSDSAHPIPPGSIGETAVASETSTSPGGGSEYQVQAGDTLWAISQKTGVPLDVLVNTNGIKNPNVIQPGQSIKLPGRASPTPAPLPLFRGGAGPTTNPLTGFGGMTGTSFLPQPKSPSSASPPMDQQTVVDMLPNRVMPQRPAFMNSPDFQRRFQAGTITPEEQAAQREYLTALQDYINPAPRSPYNRGKPSRSQVDAPSLDAPPLATLPPKSPYTAAKPHRSTSSSSTTPKPASTSSSSSVTPRPPLSTSSSLGGISALTSYKPPAPKPPTTNSLSTMMGTTMKPPVAAPAPAPIVPRTPLTGFGGMTGTYYPPAPAAPAPNWLESLGQSVSAITAPAVTAVQNAGTSAVQAAQGAIQAAPAKAAEVSKATQDAIVTALLSTPKGRGAVITPMIGKVGSSTGYGTPGHVATPAEAAAYQRRLAMWS